MRLFHYAGNALARVYKPVDLRDFEAQSPSIEQTAPTDLNF